MTDGMNNDLREEKPRGLRVGTFEMSDALILNSTNSAAQVFTLLEFVPLRAERLLGTFIYVGLSPKFQPVALGATVPRYEVTATVEDSGQVSLVTVKHLEAGA